MGNRNTDQSVIKWQLTLMSLLPSSPHARGKTVTDLCKAMRPDGPANCRGDKEGVALVRKIQKTLKALYEDEYWGPMLLCRVDGPSGFDEIDLADDQKSTSKAYWKWRDATNLLVIPPQNEDHALALLMVQKRLKDELPPATLACLEQFFEIAKKRLENLGPGNRYSKWQKKIAIRSPSQTLKPARMKAGVHDKVLRALHDECQLRLAYKKRGANNAESFLVNPLGIVLRGPVTYLVCTINEHKNVVLLSLHRIQSVEILLDTSVITPPGFKLEVFISQGAADFPIGNSADGGMIELVAEFSNVIVQHLAETPLADNQIIQPVNDSVAIVKATVPDTQQLRWWLLAFGPRVRVILPAYVREWVAIEHANAAKLYAQ